MSQGRRSPVGLSAAARRSITVPLYTLLFLIGVATAIVWVPALTIVDRSRSGVRAALRCGLFFVYYLGIEVVGIAAAFAVWCVRWLRPGVTPEQYQRWNLALEHTWGQALLAGSQRIFGFRIEVEGTQAVASGPMLLLLRHASVADTLLAAHAISKPYGWSFRYVMKRELLWDPCIDIVGLRVPNYFVDRASDDPASEVEAVRELMQGLSDSEGILIYPEGTRFTIAKRERILGRLEAQPSPNLERSRRLQNVLPPRLGGSLALLDANPGLDAVFCAHEGFDSAGTFWDLWTGCLVDRRIRVCFWRIPFSEIPKDFDGRVEWLFDQWDRVDAWVGQVKREAAGE